jgi:glycosyltransferase involved in cell wall biosynthesis
MIEWHVLTGEYPPQPGGVSDYTRQVARGLAEAGDAVNIWAPPAAGADAPHAGVIVHRLPDRFGPRSLQLLGRELDARRPARLLLQYVPHAFGWRAANLPFCCWLRSRQHDPLWVMFHEVAFPFQRGNGASRHALAAVNRVMASLVGRSADRVFVSIPGWRAQLRGLVSRGTTIEWLPVPSGIEVLNDPAGCQRVRRIHAGDRPLVGHFGTYAPAIRSALGDALAGLFARTEAHALLLGRGSGAAAREFGERFPQFCSRLHGTGVLSDADLSRHIAACDLMLQPYPDGISSRRTSAMAVLRHGRPMVTTRGRLTEPLWDESGAVALAGSGDPLALAQAATALLSDPRRREQLSSIGPAIYDAHFDLRHTIAALRGAGSPARPPLDPCGS